MSTFFRSIYGVLNMYRSDEAEQHRKIALTPEKMFRVNSLLVGVLRPTDTQVCCVLSIHRVT